MFKRTKLSAALLMACGGVLLSSGGLAQAQDNTQKLERVTITGSNIKRTDTETASPVQVISREEIERSGKQSIQEVLRGVTADGLGSIPSSFSDGFASGSAAVSLRGLGVNSTLVLVNGRRMTTYGLADDGTRNFVDLNSLPLEAVDRIEVLKDGASAIYGADAVGGVVNVILRKNYTGASIGGSYGQASRGDGKTTRAFGSLGFGDIDADKYNVFLSLEASQQKNIWSVDRGFIGQSDHTSRGYYDTTNGARRPYFSAGPTSNSPYGVTRSATGGGARVNVIPCAPSAIVPSTGLCGYNPLVEQEVQPALDRLNFFGRGTLQFSPSLTAYLEVGYFSTKSKANVTLGANNDGGVFVPGDPFNPLLVHSFMNLPAGHPDNTFGVDRSLFIRPFELGGRDQTTDNEVLRLVQGLQGTGFGWDFDVGASYIKSRLKNQNFGYIRYDVMQAALNNGTYRITSPSLTAPSVLAAISPTLENTPTSSIKSIDFKASRELMNLPGGALGLAVGGELRWEAANTPPVPFTETAEIVGLGYSAFNASRRVQAVFGELNAPVTKWLELNGALRYDRYSDFGSSTTPKVGFKIKPIDQFAVRGTYSEAFRAPGPAETGGSSFGFTTFGILSQGNPNIQPETAKSYTLGLIAEPLPGTSATLDYWKVDRKNEIVQADPNSIIGSLPTTGTPLSRISGAQPNTFIYYDANGDIGTVTGFYRNAAKTKTDGVDLELRHRMSLGEAGKLSTQLNWTHVNKFQRTDPDGNTFEYAGTHGPLVQSAGGGSPKDRMSLTLTLDRGPWAVTGGINYVGPIKMIDHKGETTDPDGSGTIHNSNTGVDYPDAGQYNCGVFDTSGNVYGGCKLPSFTTFDLFARWTPMKNLDVNFSIQNLFDRKAPFDPYLVIPYAINYNQTWHQSGAVGRFLTVGAKYSF
ncbi:TonB-dependent receptor [Methylibium sp.]|uniref:TonB-dependent receptor n=1 Tax=Methylibium sp. TaxID=2067992 RepID=UPI00286CF9B7|nr:TonB-dependent receptor [Methylibium sp.]